MQITPAEIAETLAMVSKQHLDIRTITLGLNLRGCTDADIDVMARKVYDRMTTAAEQLVPTAEQLEREYGIPIVNKRISVTPIAEICRRHRRGRPHPHRRGHGPRRPRTWASTSSAASPRLVHKGVSAADDKLMDSIPHALWPSPTTCARASTWAPRDAGINMDAVLKMGRHREGHGRGHGRPPVHRRGQARGVLQRRGGQPLHGRRVPRRRARPTPSSTWASPAPAWCTTRLQTCQGRSPSTSVAETIKNTAFQITRVGQLVAPRGQPRGWAYAIRHRGPVAGAHARRGRLAWPGSWRKWAWPVCGDPRHHGGAGHAQRRGEEGRRHGVLVSVGGLSGAFIPVSEDEGMIARRRGRRADARQAGGHDLRVLRGPGHDRRARASTHVPRPSPPSSPTRRPSAWSTARPPPCASSPRIGQDTWATGSTSAACLGYAPVMPVNRYAGSRASPHRGGRIPAPLNSLKN